MIDLRSDTVTRPTPAMRKAMAEAEVGDDVYGEDPTVNRLEQVAAELTGKEAALFVPTGIMGNTIAIKLHTQHGEEVLCDARAHLLDWELSMTAWFSGCLIRTVAAPNGPPKWQHFRKGLRAFGPHNAPTACLEIENTHNMLGGCVTNADDVAEICEEAHARGIKVHLDGARIYNAAVALGVPVAALTRDVDTVVFCLSKGLGAPVGSMLAGTAADIGRARRYRKRLGGGMRQSGILAAAGLVALDESPIKLVEDHANAKLLATAISRIVGVRLDSERVETNIVIFDITETGKTPEEIVRRLKLQGVLMSVISETEVRAVTHYDVSRRQCETAAEVLSLTLADVRHDHR